MGNHQEDEVLTPEQVASLDALNGMRTGLTAMPENEIERRITLDASGSALIAGATVIKVEPFREELVATFGAKAQQVLDELPVVALATRQADIELSMAAPSSDLTELFEQVRAIQQLLITDAESLALRGHIDAKRLEPARNVQGYLATVDSVERIVSLLRENWEKLKGHTPTTAADLDRAVVQAKRLSAAVAARDNGVNRTPAVETRIRVLREQDDVDTIVPSLWANRGRRGRSRTDVDNPAIDDDSEPASPVTPSPVNGGGPFTA